MVKVYAAALALGVVALITMVLGGAIVESRSGDRTASERVLGGRASRIVGGVLGFGMGGLSAEFSPLGFAWPISLLIAAGASIVSLLWVRYATRGSTTR